MHTMDTYRSLQAWQLCLVLVLAVYHVTARFPKSEQFGLVTQLRRAAISPCANLAEGYGRRGVRELRKFINYALGSLAEVDALLLVSHKLGYLPNPQYQELREKYQAASKTAYALLRRTRRPVS